MGITIIYRKHPEILKPNVLNDSALSHKISRVLVVIYIIRKIPNMDLKSSKNFLIRGRLCRQNFKNSDSGICYNSFSENYPIWI